MKSKNEKQLKSFIEYCEKHNEMRFWQALRNWSSYDKIIGMFWNEEDEYEKEDTYYK